jgi:endonuclease YncB( thermonuclease family)
MKKLYNYLAEITEILDADTFVLKIDVGFNISTKTHVRLYGINCPEISTKEGIAALSFIAPKIKVGDKILIATIKDKNDKYGRLLAIVWYGSDFDKCLNKELLESNNAVEFMQSKTQYW